jgi:NADPH-dependent curcumin reductase CurA
VGAVFALEEATQAFNTVLERKNIGKVIIKIREDL